MKRLRPTWLFGNTVHEGCDRGGFYEQAQFAEEYGSPLCIVKLGCWGPVVQCNVGKRGMDGRDRRLSQRRRNLHRLHHARLSRQIHAVHESAAGFASVFGAVQTYGRAIHALRRFTQSSLNKEPSWRKPRVRAKLTEPLRARRYT